MVNSLHSLHCYSGFLWTTAHHLPLLPSYCHQGRYFMKLIKKQIFKLIFFLSQQKGTISILVIIIQIFLLLFCRWSPLGHGLVSLNADAQSAKWPEWWWWLWWCLCSAGCRSSSSIWSIWWSSSRSPVPLLASTSLLSSCLMPTHVPIRFSMVSYQTTLNRASEKYVGFLLTIAVLLKPAN